ncbi:MAG: hypothetical protein OEU95_08035 [Nitrospirota bacterium]|nr:hypothetical protein [Nitrospirota bacterium]
MKLIVLGSGTVHSADSIAYRFEHGSRAVVFTGDADHDQGIIALSQNEDLMEIGI